MSTPKPRHPAAETDPAAQPSQALASCTTTDLALPVIDEAALAQAMRREVTHEERTDSVSGAVNPLDGRRQPCLVVFSGTNEQDLVELRPGEPVIIGRSATASLVIDDEGVSRAHTSILVEANGVRVEDLGSRNGTWIGSERLSGPKIVTGEALIRLGARTLLKLSYMNDIERDYQRRLLRAALRDPLTNLYNRRHFDERLAAECASALRHRRPLALALLDIDDFKRINDLHGHQTGDAVLRAVGTALAHGARREDQVFRFGGEEFALLTPVTDIEQAAIVAERLRTAVERLIVSSDAGAGQVLRVTISAGVAGLDDAEDGASLIEHADEALYRAKREGKNRVVVWRPERRAA